MRVTGRHQISWFANSLSGRPLASSMYLAVLEADTFQGKPLKLLPK